jgi:hypothetical protein
MKQGKIVENHEIICFYKDNKLHSYNDEPAVIRPNGTKEWYQNGKLHRDGDLPAVVWDDKTMFWYKDGKIHRNNDLPAVIRPSGTSEWYQNGKLHRIEGGAIEWANWGSYYYVDGVQLTKEQHANHPEVKKYKLQQILNRLTA